MVSALTVNLSSVDASNWTTTKTAVASLSSYSSYWADSAEKVFNIPITVVPCEITSINISDITSEINSSSSSSTHGEFSYTNTESTTSFCGAIIYELVNGDTSSLTYDSLSRSITFSPTVSATTSYTIRAKSTNFPLNTIE